MCTGSLQTLLVLLLSLQGSPNKSVLVTALSPGQSCLDPQGWENCWHLEL